MSTAASTLPARRRISATAAVPGWVRALGWVAGGKIALSATGVFSPAYAYPIPAGVFFLLAAGFGFAGGYLLVMGGRDRRTQPLGMFLLLVGSAFAKRLLWAGAATVDPLLVHVQQLPVEAFLPFFLWRFVGDFPRRPAWQPRLVRWMSSVSLGAGVALAAFALAQAVRAGDGAQARVDPPLLWFTVFGLMLPAFPHAMWRARGATADERRRVRIVLVGITLGFGPVLAAVLLSALPAFDALLGRPGGLRLVGMAVYPPLLSIPLTLLYAVLVHRALDLRAIVRRALQYATARYTFTALCAVPFVAVAATMVQRRAEPMAALWSGERGVALTAALGVGALGLLLRRSALAALDRRFFREQYDARLILGELVERVRLAGTPAELGQVLQQRLDAALHLRFVRLLVLHPAAGALVPVDAGGPPLPLAGRLARRIEQLGVPVEVSWGRRTPWLARLPRADQSWLADSDAHLLAPLNAADGSLLGALCLGGKRSELPFTSEDLLLISAVASSAGAWLEHHLAVRPGAWLAPDADAPDHALARECTACGAVADENDAGTPCPACGSPTRAAALPRVVNAKYQLTARIGAGGMGVVYRALDLSLHRAVAIKALPRVSPAAVFRLRDEARAMAAASHPGLAIIFAVESWGGRPMLVVEYLAGGTLDERLARGRCDPREAVDVVLALAPALERLHAAGILHGDIKPSNIGFAEEGAPRLLDFGLSRVLDDARGEEGGAETVGEAGWGTPLYLSPEVARGETPPDAAADLWALALVLYEAVAGRHPFAGGSAHRVLLSIYDGAVPDLRRFVPDAPAPLAELLAAALHSDRRARPATAAELHHRLRACRVAL